MNYILLSTGVIVLSILTFYYNKKSDKCPTKVIIISWSKDQDSLVTSKLSKLSEKSFHYRYKRMAQFEYNLTTYGKLSRWRDKKYIEYVGISPVAVPA